MKFIVPELPIRENDESKYSASWMVKCLHWYCRLGWYIGETE